MIGQLTHRNVSYREVCSLDKMNLAILKRLKANARRSWQDIGREVHLTGQAVAARVQNMEAAGMITGYTVRQDRAKRHFITVFMENNRFDDFERFLEQSEWVESAWKTTGEGCYHVVFVPPEDSALEPFLNGMLAFARYKTASVLRCVK